MKRSLQIIGLLAIVLSGFSQTVDDALRYSQQYYEGSARSMAMGSSFGALGPDFSVASTNPAGLALYRSSEFVITPEVSNMRTNSLYNGTLGEDSRTIFNLANIGYVQTKPLHVDGWKYFQFAVGMNRLNNYNNRKIMQGENTVNTRLDIYLDLADGVHYSDIEDDPYGRNAYDLNPAWWLYLIDTIPGYDDLYYTPAVPFAGTMQKEMVTSKGSNNEWLMSFSGNYNDKLFLGLTVGMPYQRYYRESVYSEYDIADTIPAFTSWSVRENLKTTGWGINLKLGLIYQPIEWIRIGGAFHTPTYYWMRDSWYTTHTVDWEGSYDDPISSPTGYYEYSLTTPLRAIGDVAFLIGRVASFTAEYEFVDYANAKFKARDYSFSDVNSQVKTSYASTHNIRFGTEWRYSNLSFRGGYALYTSPYSNNLNDGKRQSFSLGIGYNFGEGTIDFAYVRYLQNEDYYMYSDEYFQPNAVRNDMTGQNFVLTLKGRF
jgi:hypothetical protein